MADLNLGNKFECYNCGTRFYDLGKSESICPKCGANQKDSDRGDKASAAAPAKRKRKVEVPKPVEVDEEVPIEDLPDDALPETEIETETELADDEEEEDLEEEA
jgi:hypothetical protein